MATRFCFNIPLLSEDIQSIIRYKNAVRNAVDTVERVGLTVENLILNIPWDNLPSKVRLPLVEKLDESWEDFKFIKILFEK